MIERFQITVIQIIHYTIEHYITNIMNEERKKLFYFFQGE